VADLLGSEIVDAARLAGGDVAAVYRLTLRDGRVVVAKPGATAATEADMLRAIRAAGAPAPAVLAATDGLLVMEHVPTRGSLAEAWDDLAAVLLRLHGSHGESYGWPVDHAFGSVAIPNRPGDDWPAFWAGRRLRPSLPHLAADLARRVERIADRLADHLPARPPASLLHGDLWGGNVLVAGGRIAGLIDPACYHGDREVDVAMLTMFDRPPPSFFASLGMASGWQARLPVYRLWPLLVHVRLFGGGYAGQLSSALTELGA
jgi:fructosamine-3-kinase